MTSPLQSQIASLIYTGMRGLFLDATLTRDGANTTGEGYSPNLAEATVYSCKAIPLEHAKGTRGGDLAGTTEVAVMILANSFKTSSGASVSVKPETLDRIAVPVREIEGVIPDRKKAVTSDPARATWTCWVVT